MGDTTNSLQVHSIESFGTHDGPGIRLVIFLQGCKFKCLYCHNPDTIPLEGGHEVNIDTLVQRAKNMVPYFKNNGGLTVSGGEPLLQSKKLLPLFQRLKDEGIHTCIDTNGRVLNPSTKTLLDEHTDLVLLDIKHFDGNWHRKITGGQPKDFSLRFAAHREMSGKPMWLRYVLVPGWTDQEEHLRALGEHFKDYKTIEAIEIQPYHKLGVHKWEKLGWEYGLKDVPENTPEQIEKARKIFTRYFKEVRVN